MNLFFESLFWVSIALIVYAYFGYVIILKVISFFSNKKINKAEIFPKVSMIITAFNEEKRIREKIENTLKQTYPKERLEIIVASDGSDDQTDSMVMDYENQGIRLIKAPERRGKEATQKLAIEAASGDILIFSDVATILDPQGIASIVKNFNDPTIGCVSSRDRFIDLHGNISGEGAYVRYEMYLRVLETRVNSLVGLSGSFFAARKEVCQDWAIDLQSDFNTLLNSIKIGLRGVLDTESIGYYKNIEDEKKEFERKVRTVLRGISVFMKNLALLNVYKYRIFSWQLFSHKLCRWLVPFAMLLVFLTNAWLSFVSSFYLFTFVLQILFYAFAMAGWLTGRFIKKTLLKIPWFFLMANLSIFNAWVRYLRGERMVSWTPSER